MLQGDWLIKHYLMRDHDEPRWDDAHKDGSNQVMRGIKWITLFPQQCWTGFFYKGSKARIHQFHNHDRKIRLLTVVDAHELNYVLVTYQTGVITRDAKRGQRGHSALGPKV